MTLRQETLSEAPTEPIGVAPLVFLLALFLVLHTAIALNLDWSLAAHQYLGTDTYSRMVRVQDLMATGDWFDPTYRRVNPPYGHLSHWSRPMDAVILAETLLLATVMETADALYWAGATISPILHLLTLAIVVFGTRPLFGNTWAILCGLLFLVQPPITQTFMIGRPDHHSLQLFITAAMIMAALHLIIRPLNRQVSSLTGALFSLALWTGVETILPIVGIIGSLVLSWIIWRRDLALKMLHVSIGAIFVATIALFLERGPNELLEIAIEIDRLSWLHVIYFGLFLFFSLGIVFWDRRGPGTESFFGRAAVVAGWGLIALGGLWLAQPEIFAGQWISFDKLYAGTRGGQILEYKSFDILKSFESDGFLVTISRIAFNFGYAIAGLIFLAFLLPNPRDQRCGVWILSALCAGTVAAFLMFRSGSITLRDAPILGFILLFPYTELVARIFNGFSNFSAQSAALLRSSSLAFLLVWPLLTVSLLRDANPEKLSGTLVNDRGITKACRLTELARYLGEVRHWRDRPRSIMTLADFGPEIMYRSPHFVFSIPNHRPQTGYTDTMRVMTAPNDDLARRLLNERQVDLLLLCRSSALASFYHRGSQILGFGNDIFRDRLIRGQLPNWLKPVELPANVSRSFILLEVKREMPSSN